MEQVKLLQKIAQDVGTVKAKVERIEQDLDELSSDLHQVKPEYIEKLKKIDSGRFVSRGELEKELGE